jgi:hypothetical protein
MTVRPFLALVFDFFGLLVHPETDRPITETYL